MADETEQMIWQGDVRSSRMLPEHHWLLTLRKRARTSEQPDEIVDRRLW